MGNLVIYDPYYRWGDKNTPSGEGEVETGQQCCRCQSLLQCRTQGSLQYQRNTLFVFALSLAKMR